MKLWALFAAAALFVVSLSAAERPKEFYDPDVQRLLDVNAFVFGPVGFGGELSKGETAFAAILKKKDSIRYILAAFDHGMPEARCYALVALREMSDTLYDECERRMRTNPPREIGTIKGESVVGVPTAEVLAAIDRGVYRKYFLQHEEPR